MGYDFDSGSGGDDIADIGGIGLDPQLQTDESPGDGGSSGGDDLMQPGDLGDDSNAGEGPVPQEAIDQVNADQVFDRSIDANYQRDLNLIAGGSDDLGTAERTAELGAVGAFDHRPSVDF